MLPDQFGRKAYFDMGTSKIVYFDPIQNTFEFPVTDL
jgi:hypothetical protein